MPFSEVQIIAKSDGKHMNNMTYLEYLELARKGLYDYCKTVGVEGVIANISADYRREVRNNDVLTVHTEIEKIGNTSVTLNQTIVTEENELVVSAKATLVTINRETRQKVTVPDKVRKLAQNAESLP